MRNTPSNRRTVAEARARRRRRSAYGVAALGAGSRRGGSSGSGILGKRGPGPLNWRRRRWLKLMAGLLLVGLLIGYFGPGGTKARLLVTVVLVVAGVAGIRLAIPGLVTPARAAAGAGILLVGSLGGFLIKADLSLAHLFGTDPLSAARDAIFGGGQAADDAKKDQRINLVLYGYGGSGHDGAYLSDSILLVSIQTHQGETAQIVEMSIPRDWYVPQDLGGGKTYSGRINEAYATGLGNGPAKATLFQDQGNKAGGMLANHDIGTLLGIPINYFVGVDFTAFKSAVESLGGIDVDVPHTFSDNQYPRGECSGNARTSDCSLITVHFDQGRQHMNGEQALEFARSRHSTDNGEGTDFARNSRQQLVTSAIKQKALSVGGIGNLPDLLNQLGDHVIMGLGVNDAKALYEATKGVDQANIRHVSLDSTNFLYECGYPQRCEASYLYTHDNTFHSVQHFAQNMVIPSDVLSEQAGVVVESGSSALDANASRRWATMLGSIGLSTSDGGLGKHSATTHVIDNSGGKGSKTAQWLASYFGVTVESPSASSPAPQGAVDQTTVASGVTVVLGADEEQSFHNTTRVNPYSAETSQPTATADATSAADVTSPGAATAVGTSGSSTSSSSTSTSSSSSSSSSRTPRPTASAVPNPRPDPTEIPTPTPRHTPPPPTPAASPSPCILPVGC